FEGHDELDRVEAVGAEIVDEARVLRHLLGIDAKVLNHDLLHPFCDIAHLKPRLPSLTSLVKGPSPASDRSRPAHGTGEIAQKIRSSLPALAVGRGRLKNGRRCLGFGGVLTHFIWLDQPERGLSMPSHGASARKILSIIS